MRARGLRAHHAKAPRAAGTETTHGLRPGDFVLSRAHGIKHRLIRFGQNLRLEGDARQYADYTHAALVVSESGSVIEARSRGVTETCFERYLADNESHQVVRVDLSETDRRKIVEFAGFARGKPYGFLANISMAIWILTGSRLVFFLDGSFTCSGLVAEALVRTGIHFETSSAHVMPAQLAAVFHAAPPAVGEGNLGRAPLVRNGVRR